MKTNRNLNRLNTLAQKQLSKYPADKVLSLAADILEAKGAWIQGNMCALANGTKKDEFDSNAVSFDIEGAILKAQLKLGSRRARVYPYAPFVYAIANLGENTIADWQDRKRRKKSEVIDVLRRAAKLSSK